MCLYVPLVTMIYNKSYKIVILVKSIENILLCACKRQKHNLYILCLLYNISSLNLIHVTFRDKFVINSQMRANNSLFHKKNLRIITKELMNT